MKIIAIMGSPRGKGSGYKIVKKIEERMMRGRVDFEYLDRAKTAGVRRLYSLIARVRGQCKLAHEKFHRPVRLHEP